MVIGIDASAIVDLSGFGASISSDGRYVAYHATASSGAERVIRIADTVTNVVSDITGIFGLPPNSDTRNLQISGDGRFLVFDSAATNLVEAPLARENNVFVTDLYTSTTELVSLSNDIEGNGYSRSPSISADGSRIVFQTRAVNLVEVERGDPIWNASTTVLYEEEV